MSSRTQPAGLEQRRQLRGNGVELRQVIEDHEALEPQAPREDLALDARPCGTGSHVGCRSCRTG
ncbi:MAG: hypothetical protein U1F35_10245 [Steroidobacteraceae bacterium]